MSDKVSLFNRPPLMRSPTPTPAPRFLTSTNNGTSFTSLPGIELKEKLTPRVESGAFAGCEKRSLLSGWGHALGMFSDWIFGTGQPNRTFTQCSLEVQNMADSWGVNRARDYYYNRFAGKPFSEWKPVTDIKGPFGLNGLLEAGLDPTEQFVGSFRIDISPEPDRTLKFELTNNTSLQSFLYGHGPDYERNDFAFGGNMRQIYTWNEPLRGE